MKITNKLFLMLLLINVTVGLKCQNNKIPKKHFYNQVFNYKVSKKLVAGKSDTILLQVSQDTLRNFFINLKDLKGYLYESIGLSSLDIEKGDTNSFVEECKLQPDTLKQFVIKTYVWGANYDARVYFVIWFDHTFNFWRLSELKYPYKGICSAITQPEIKDVYGNGISEVIEHYNSINKNGDIFKFDNGKLIPLNFKNADPENCCCQ